MKGLLIAIVLLPVLVLGVLFVLFLPPPGPTPILTEIAAKLHDRSRELAPGALLSIRLPTPAGGEMVLLAMDLYATMPPYKDPRFSRSAESIISRDTTGEGAGLTFLYHVRKGEIRGRLSVSRCNLTIKPGDPLIITPSSGDMVLDCGPLGIPYRADCGKDTPGLWNEHCVARLVQQ